MKRKILSILLSTIVVTAFSTTHTITNSGTTFSPATITIDLGDSVKFNLGSMHNAVEVSEATWNANGTTALPGFSLPLGGGLVLPDQLTVGTHFFVCTPHASLGMKGKIIVVGTTEVKENSSKADISIFPNPSNGLIQLTISGSETLADYNLEVFDISGASVSTKILSNQNISNHIDLSELPKGIYFLRIYNETELYTKKIVLK